MRPAAALPCRCSPRALAGCRAGGPAAEASPAPAPRPVQVAEVGLRPAPRRRAAYTGTVRARREADVGFRTGGRIAERLVEVGDDGRRRAATRPPRPRRPRAVAARRGGRPRRRRGAGPPGRDRCRAVAHAARRRPCRRRLRRPAPGRGARARRRRVAAARAALELARNRLDYATLRAPTAGVVTALLAEAGQVVAGRPAGAAPRQPGRARTGGAACRNPRCPACAGAAAEARFWARPGRAACRRAARAVAAGRWRAAHLCRALRAAARRRTGSRSA